MICDYFWITAANDSVENYADLFTIALRNDDIQELDSKWGEILLSMTQIPSDDILEGLYKLRIRESGKLKTVLELYNMKIHQKTAGPDYHRLKTMVKRSIEQNLRIKNFEARNGNYERNAVVKNQRVKKQRVQRILGDCWQWDSKGQCSRGDNCSFRHDINKRAKMTQPNPSPCSSSRQSERNASRTRSPRGKSPSGRISRWPCKDYPEGTCTNSFCEKWHPPECLFYKTKSGCRFGEKCSCAHRQVEEQPTKRSKKNGDKSAVAMLKIHDKWVACFRIWSRRSLHRCCGRAQTYGNQSDVLNSQKPSYVMLTFETKNPSLGMICPGDPHQRKPNAPKFDDRSQEETEWKERCVGEAAWSLAKSILSPSENWCLPAANLKPEEREFVVDSGASMHMISKKDLSSAEMDTSTTSRSPTTVITANGEVQTHEEATFCVKCIIDNEKSSRIRQQFYRSESFAVNTDTHMNGSTVKNHISLKTVFGQSATQRTSFRSWFLVYQRVLPQACPLLHPWYLQGRKLIILRLPQARLLHQLQQHQATGRFEKERIKVELIPIP